MNTEHGPGSVSVSGRSSRRVTDLFLDRDGAVLQDGEHHAFALRDGVDEGALRVLHAPREAVDCGLQTERVRHYERRTAPLRVGDDVLVFRPHDHPCPVEEVRVGGRDLGDGLALVAVLNPLLHQHSGEVHHRRAGLARAVARTLEEPDGGLRRAHPGGDEHPADTPTAERLLADEAGVLVAHPREEVGVGATLRSLLGIAEDDDAFHDFFAGHFFAHDDLVERVCPRNSERFNLPQKCFGVNGNVVGLRQRLAGSWGVYRSFRNVPDDFEEAVESVENVCGFEGPLIIFRIFFLFK